MKILRCLAYSVPLVLQFSCTIQPGSLRFSEFGLNPAPRAPELADTYPVKHELAPRTYVNSVLKNVFSIADKSFEDNELKNPYSNNNVRFNSEYGGGCDIYATSEKVINPGAEIPSFAFEFPDDDCAKNGSVHLESASSAGRFAVTNTVCDFLIKRDVMSFTALRKVKPGWSNAVATDPTEQDALAIYRLFLPDETPPPEVLAELMKVAASGSTPAARWKNLLYFVCILPDWQDLR